MSQNTKILFRAVQFVWYVEYLVASLLLLRFILKLLGANEGAVFTNLVYNVSYAFLWPFQFVFNPIKFAGGVFETSTILAVIIYYLIAVIIVKALAQGREVSSLEANSELRVEE